MKLNNLSVNIEKHKSNVEWSDKYSIAHQIIVSHPHEHMIILLHKNEFNLSLQLLGHFCIR